ncbi:hypothetical protein [Streptomyces sp. UNOB3_S3]|uniref:hypothetical protein n=1 Tax=Streptomyces sp. UNOB3_S3 TaxID=2871682 RepID=UPI001E547DED|nr:hypothetical protein [Streptomyces sp. UNOB3_S3]MCC3773851.1 hypothetical protein [Streptomyces sp. UNOB3_S3]
MTIKKHSFCVWDVRLCLGLVLVAVAVIWAATASLPLTELLPLLGVASAGTCGSSVRVLRVRRH